MRVRGRCLTSGVRDCWQAHLASRVMRSGDATRARGGHFAPFEEPELYAEELHAFFRPYRAAATG
jgi:hypothetical protein